MLLLRQITLPKPIRQSLGVDHCGMAFDLRGTQVVVNLVDDASHDDPAIGNFLSLLEADIRSGRNLTALHDDLVQGMLASLTQSIDLAANIEGDVEL